MAEFALGLTKTAVEGTLIRVKSAIEEEAKLKVQVQNDLLFITGEFEMMRSFLKVASKERAKNEVVQTWVRQLRDLAFDVEDCVEFVVHLDHESAWSWFWRIVPSCMTQPLPLDLAVAEIQQLKARVDDVSQRNTRYSLISDTNSGSSNSTETVKALEQQANRSASSSPFYILNKVWKSLGKQRGMDELKNLITSEGSDRQVVSVWGTTGDADLGTSSIFRKAYSDPEICHEFKNRAWVELTTHPFSRHEFLKSLLNQLSSEQEYFDLEQLMEKLKKQRYLIILEHVSSMVEWNALSMCLPDSNNGSRIIVSTQDLGTALFCTGELYLVSELTRFSRVQSLCAFHKKGSMCRSDMGKFNWQLRRRGVISVWGASISNAVLYKGVIQKCIETEFEQQMWFNIIERFDLEFFARSLLVRTIPEDEEEKIEAVYHMEIVEVFQDFSKFLREHDCLIVINGLPCTSDWDLIKENFLSKPVKSSIVVITNEAKVAAHCADEYRMLNIRDVLTQPARLTKGGQYYGKGRIPESSERESQLCTNRYENARAWNSSYYELGHWDDERKLRESLTYPGVICVWGIPGVGKSALVKTIYYGLIERAIEKDIVSNSRAGRDVSRLQLSYSWVDVPSPFNLTELSQNLLLDVFSDDPKAMEDVAFGMMEGQDPIQWCREFLLQDQCLVVIDGLQSTHDWDLIKDAFLSEPTKCCIIVITNEESVGTYCLDHKYRVLNIKSLEADMAVDLFEKIALSWDDKELTPGELELSKVTISMCGGLPKVIAAIGEYCRASPITSLECLNADFIGILERDRRFDSLRGLFSWMHLKFDASSDSLKPCIFYLPVFPIYHKIRRSRLLRRWIAEGYSRDTSAGITAEENGEIVFSKLVNLGIIQMWQPPSCSKEGMCHVNGFFHGYIISRTMLEDNLVYVLDGCCSLNSQRTGRHVSILESWDRDINVFESTDLSRLRSLTVFGKWESFLISAKMKRLRVLDLEGTSGVTDDDLEKIGKLLRSLKFLSLRGCRAIRRLPDSMGGLVQLQTLDVRHTSIVTLPPSIIKLRELKYIRAGTRVDVNDRCTSTPEEDKAGAVADEVETTWASSLMSKLCRHRGPNRAGTSQQQLLDVNGNLISDEVPTSSQACTTTWVPSLPSKCCRHRGLVGARVNGVKVPNPRVGKLTALHTIGVVNVDGGASGNLFLKELKKLTQLRRLGLSGINQKNWHDMCSAISGHSHLESLSVHVDDEEDQCSLGDISKPPKTLKSLKLYGGNVQLPVAWMKQLSNLRKAHLQDHDLTVSTQEDIDGLTEMQFRDMYHHLCVKPIQDGELRYGRQNWRGVDFSCARTLKVDCSSYKVAIVFGPSIPQNLEVLVVHCSTAKASLELSGIYNLNRLREVQLKGFYNKTVEQQLQQVVDYFEGRVVLNRDPQQMQQTPCFACVNTYLLSGSKRS